MRTSTLLTVALAAGVFAAPHPRNLHKRVLVTETIYQTVTVDFPLPTPKSHVHKTTSTTLTTSSSSTSSSTSTTPTSTSTPPVVVVETPAPAVLIEAPTPTPEPVVETPTPTPEPVVVVSTPVAEVAAAAATTAAPVTTTSSNDDGSPLSGGVSILSTVNKYRSLYNLPTFTWSSTLEKNALKTVTDGGGVTQTHELNPGTMGQVLSPGMSTAVVSLGSFTPFEASYLAWMCEKSSDSQISALCPLMQNILHMSETETGHYDILTSSSYSKIGCAFFANPNAASGSPYQGLWGCDVA